MLRSPGSQQQRRTPIPNGVYCEEKNRLLGAFLDAIHHVNYLQNQQVQSVIDGEPDFCRFDVLLHCAQEQKETAKYAWMTHVQAHGCHSGDEDEWD